MQLTRLQTGFSLIEMLVVIIVIGILASVAMQSMTATMQDVRRVKTEREMAVLAEAIAGNPALTQAGVRSDFGYVGDVGAFPPNLEALRQNPGGFSTWDGPYLPPNLAEDNAGYLLDEWGSAYSYNGITIASTGSGSTITRRIAESTGDYLLNRSSGTIKDAAEANPGAAYDDSVDIVITIPNGVGGMLSKAYHPGADGTFVLDSLPVGEHRLDIIFVPTADTLHRYVTVLPRNKLQHHYRFAEAYF
jgi:prepilin-type N-terminal cleavage/methylation domain-containing protein